MNLQEFLRRFVLLLKILAVACALLGAAVGIGSYSGRDVFAMSLFFGGVPAAFLYGLAWLLSGLLQKKQT